MCETVEDRIDAADRLNRLSSKMDYLSLSVSESADGIIHNSEGLATILDEISTEIKSVSNFIR